MSGSLKYVLFVGNSASEVSRWCWRVWSCIHGRSFRTIMEPPGRCGWPLHQGELQAEKSSRSASRRTTENWNVELWRSLASNGIVPERAESGFPSVKTTELLKKREIEGPRTNDSNRKQLNKAIYRACRDNYRLPNYDITLATKTAADLNQWNGMVPSRRS